jgi:hypothetical protein
MKQYALAPIPVITARAVQPASARVTHDPLILRGGYPMERKR